MRYSDYGGLGSVVQYRIRRFDRTQEDPVESRRAPASQIVLLWLLVLFAFAMSTRRGTLVPWGSGEGPTPFGAPLWTLFPLVGTLAVIAVVTLSWWRRR